MVPVNIGPSTATGFSKICKIDWRPAYTTTLRTSLRVSDSRRTSPYSRLPSSALQSSPVLLARLRLDGDLRGATPYAVPTSPDYSGGPRLAKSSADWLPVSSVGRSVNSGINLSHGSRACGRSHPADVPESRNPTNRTSRGVQITRLWTDR